MLIIVAAIGVPFAGIGSKRFSLNSLHQHLKFEKIPLNSLPSPA